MEIIEIIPMACETILNTDTIPAPKISAATPINKIKVMTGIQ